MIHLVKEVLKNVEIHLASASPRRKNILQHVGLEFQVTPSTFAEDLDKSMFPEPQLYVMENAKQKAHDVASMIGGKNKKNPWLIIGADTVVVAGGKILEKPEDHEKAYEMLQGLCKLKKHQVFSGVTLLMYEPDKDFVSHQFFECTDVVFGEIPDRVLKNYADSVEPIYGIQDVGGSLIEKINGCYYNVQGFPLYKFCMETCKFLAEKSASAVP